MKPAAKLSERYRHHLGSAPRRTNEAWLGDMDLGDGVFVCGHKFMVRLEGTALEIWRLMDGRHTAREIAEALGRRYVSPAPEAILENTLGCLRQLEELGLAAWRSRPLFEEIDLDD